ncbi:TldD/PmbA family protein [Leptospira sp. GIMC2001]|uniref:TldD/PmbA family protein n=1 Tax=Leptospira sp. GIMC2001 TaxID=1513297 RepID=UPI0023494F39|nr:TldD/PmbA family protein [Leptospira sp. GIMC2001]WCL48029.1 TldD/PmbA family protein [Leptospira sp. GIMC2001]
MTIEELESKKQQILERISSAIDQAKKEGIAQSEIFTGYANGASVTIEKNDIQTYETYEETVYGVRVIENGSEGFVTTNDAKDLIGSIREAKALALAQGTPDPDLELAQAPAEISPPINHLDPSLSGYDPDSVLEIAKKILSIREAQFPKVSLDSADASFSYSLKAMASSKGVLRSEASSSLSASFMGMAIDGDDISSFDSESAFGRTPDDFLKNFDEKYFKFLHSCMSGLGARTISGFKGNVYLPPDSIFSFLIGGFLSSLSATAVRKKKSKMIDRMNQLVMSPKLSIVSRPTDLSLESATSFDRDGQNTRDIDIVTNGVLRTFFYNHYEAKKAGLESSNGCATGGSGGTPGCGPPSLQVEPGPDSLKSMLNAKDKTIWVNRFSGTSSAASGDFSGVVKGGFLLENGEKIPVKEVQVAGNMYEILEKKIAAVSLERELLGKSTWAPSILIEGMTITGTE